MSRADRVGRYFVLEGPDGCGKSTQAQALCTFLQQQGREVVHLREPGSTPVGEALRQLLLSPQTGELRPFTEALLFTAARAELARTVIAPALQRGAVVVVERCWLSTLAYQVADRPGDGLDAALVVELTRRAHGEVVPDAVFVLDVPPEVGEARRRHRHADRFEGRDAEYHARVRRAFLGAAAAEATAQVVPAAGGKEAVQLDLQQRVRRWLG